MDPVNDIGCRPELNPRGPKDFMGYVTPITRPPDRTSSQLVVSVTDTVVLTFVDSVTHTLTTTTTTRRGSFVGRNPDSTNKPEHPRLEPPRRRHLRRLTGQVTRGDNHRPTTTLVSNLVGLRPPRPPKGPSTELNISRRDCYHDEPPGPPGQGELDRLRPILKQRRHRRPKREEEKRPDERYSEVYRPKRPTSLVVWGHRVTGRPHRPELSTRDY